MAQDEAMVCAEPSETALQLRPVEDADAAALCAIYNPYVADTAISFEEAPVEVGNMRERIAQVRTAGLPWLVADSGGAVRGYAYAAPFRARSAYRFTVETTIYLERTQVGLGLGTTLYLRLLATLRELGLHSVVAGIALPNAASVALHQRLGFRQVARFEQVGWKLGRWVDVGHWQLFL